MARRAFETAMNLKGKAKVSALEKILIDPLYAGTNAHTQVQLELAKLAGAKTGR